MKTKQCERSVYPEEPVIINVSWERLMTTANDEQQKRRLWEAQVG